ncbi:MAG: poly-gamma-glutamate synthase PgsB [Oscillospiraceae bacterium]|nr:poly-gamma-glutamate synthase PgsB [Oscillospiraceae bacterium]
MALIAAGLLVVILTCLALERRRALQNRKKLQHVIHVNGIRGKSTVTRMIDAGLRAGGFRVFCKTTGTVPMIIGTDHTARPLRRRGRANIKEQLDILRLAAQEEAQILVLECMAVDPALQRVAQHEMVRADIGVITNVRLDHTAEMGETLEEICDSLSSTIPKNGILFTADEQFFSRLAHNGEQIGCRTELARPKGNEPEFEFPENLALALSVCRYLGVAEETALKGMLHYQRDPYALSLYRLPGGGIFINGLSINDPQSTRLVFERLAERFDWDSRDLILLINNRPDRGYRTEHMVMVAQALQPTQVWLLGASQRAAARAILKKAPQLEVRRFSRAGELPLDQIPQGKVIFAVGNVAGPGHEVMRRVREEGEEYVS